MADLFHDILNHLKATPTDINTDITNFIRQLDYTTTDTTEGTISILKTLGDLQQKRLVISSVTNSSGQTYKSEELTYKHLREIERTKTFNDLTAVVNITTNGKNYLSEKLRQKRQDDLLEKQANSSLSTNRISKRNSNIQLVVSVAAILIAIISALISYWNYMKPTTSNAEIEKHLRTLDTSTLMLQKQLQETQRLEHDDSILLNELRDTLRMKGKF